MEQLTRDDIKTIVSDVIAPFIIDIKALYTSNEKEIERLTKQSTEHYANFKSMEDKLQGQMMQCQNSMNNSAEKSGVRVGEIEKDITELNLRVKTVEEQLETNENKRQFNLTSIIAVIGIGVLIFFEILSRLGS